MSNETPQKQHNVSNNNSSLIPQKKNNVRAEHNKKMSPNVQLRKPGEARRTPNGVNINMHNTPGVVNNKQEARPQQPATKNIPAVNLENAEGKKKLIKPVAKTKVRKTTLQVSRIRPFTVFRMTLLLNMAIAIIIVAASLILWFFMNVTGVIDNVNDLIRQTMNQSEQGFDIREWFTPWYLTAVSLMVGIVSAVLLSALAALGAMVYNVAVQIVGGFDITLTDES